MPTDFFCLGGLAMSALLKLAGTVKLSSVVNWTGYPVSALRFAGECWIFDPPGLLFSC